MNVLHILRKPAEGYSIETQFAGLRDEVRRQTGRVVRSVSVPADQPTLRNVWQNLRFVRRLRADLYHITGDVHYVALALPAARTVLTIHDCVSLERTRQNGHYVRFALLWLLYYYWPIRRAAHVVAVSAKTRADLRHYVGARLAQKVRIIPNYTAPDLAYQPRPFRTDAPVLLHIGVTPNKNLDRLLRALADIRCRLVVVGDAPAPARTLARDLNVVLDVVTGLSREQLIAHYVACDLVAFVSTYEGFGLPILEANAIGRPVLTSDRAPMRDVAGGSAAAHLVDPDDVASIRAGVLRLINDAPYRDALVQAGRRNAERFRLGAVAAHYVALYESFSPEPVLA